MMEGCMVLDFYYFSYQCLLNDNMIRLLNEYRDKIDINLYDISNNHLLAGEMKMFFPTLIVLDKKKRYYSPLRKSFLEQAANGIYPEEKPFLPTISRNFTKGIIEPLSLDKFDIACECCGDKTSEDCKKKIEFLKQYELDIYGFIHKNGKGELVGGVEYLPAKIIPYDIPHDEDTAFLTCVYMTDAAYDYKSAPLMELEKYLTGEYKRILAISDEKGVFPNGDLDFFISNGFRDEGVIFEDENYCRLHLMTKKL